MDGWIEIAERLPRIEQDVLGVVQGFDGPRRDLVWLGRSGHWYCVDSTNDSPVVVSHWQPLPMLPRDATSRPPPAVGKNTGSTGPGHATTTPARRAGGTHLGDCADSPPLAAFPSPSGD